MIIRQEDNPHIHPSLFGTKGTIVVVLTIYAVCLIVGVIMVVTL